MFNQMILDMMQPTASQSGQSKLRRLWGTSACRKHNSAARVPVTGIPTLHLQNSKARS